MAEGPDSELEQAFHDTADAEVAALGSGSKAKQIALLVAILVGVIGAGVGVGYAVFAASR